MLLDLWLVSRAATGVLDAALSSTGLTGEEFAVYSVLTSADTLTPTELARWMSAAPTTVSSTIKRLEGRGHVVRERNANDGRSYVLRLTAAGHRAHQEAGARFVPVLAAVVDALGSREPSIRRSLATLRAALADAAEPRQ